MIYERKVSTFLFRRMSNILNFINNNNNNKPVRKTKNPEKVSKIKNIITKVSSILSENNYCKSIIIICSVLRVKKYDWCYFLEIADESGSIDASIQRKLVQEDIDENYRLKIYGLIKVNNKYTKLEISIKNYEILNEKTKTNLQLLYEKLQQQGLLGQTKRVIGDCYKSIGLITSLNAAGLKDSLQVLTKNMLWGRVVIYPTLVQGQKTAQNVVKCIEKANKEDICDILLITRGGGSKSDLEWFNDYNLARAIMASNIPVVSGIGHEIDKTIVDEVAEKSFITPTDAANNLTNGFNKYKIKIDAFLKIYMNMIDMVIYRTSNYVTKLEDIQSLINKSTERRIAISADRYNNQIAVMNAKSNQYKIALSINGPSVYIQNITKKLNLYESVIYGLIQYNLNVTNNMKTRLDKSISTQVKHNNTPIIFKKTIEESYKKNRKNKLELLFIDGSVNIEYKII